MSLARSRLHRIDPAEQSDSSAWPMVRSPVATYVGLLYDVAKLVDLDLMLLDRLLNNGELALVPFKAVDGASVDFRQ